MAAAMASPMGAWRSRADQALSSVAWRHALHSADEVIEAEGFRDEGRGGKFGRPVRRIACGRHDDDRGRMPAATELGGEAPSVEDRHAHVEQDHVGRLLLEDLESVRSICG